MELRTQKSTPSQERRMASAAAKLLNGAAASVTLGVGASALYEEEGMMVMRLGESEAKVWRVLVEQIWVGLPGYCWGTIDLKEVTMDVAS